MLDELYLDKMTVAEMSVDKMTCCQYNLFDKLVHLSLLFKVWLQWLIRINSLGGASLITKGLSLETIFTILLFLCNL